MKKCPFCAELIQDQAVKCHYCREFQYASISSKRGARRGFLILLALIFVIAVAYLFPMKYRQPRVIVKSEEVLKKAANKLPAAPAKPAELSKIDLYLQAYPAYFGLTSGDQTTLGKYWYKNNQIYPRKVFYFDTLEQLDVQKLKYTTSQNIKKTP